MSKPDREAMLDRDCIDLSMRRQCTLLRLARSGVYRRKAAPDPDDLAVMKRIDELYWRCRFMARARWLKRCARRDACVNRKRVRRLMRLMVWWPWRPSLARASFAAEQDIPYLLRGLTIEQPNHVWAADITYIPMAKGFLYLVAIIDWASRAVLAWRLSNTMDTAFCLEALHEALVRFGKPEIFHTGQGAQFTSTAFTGRPPDRRHPHLNGRARSLDGQRFHRAGLALAQIRGGTSQSIYGRP